MAYLYDQDNPQAMRSSSSNNQKNTVVKDENCYERQATNLVRKSTMSPARREMAKVIKRQQRRKEHEKRLAILCAASLIIGGITVSAVDQVIDSWKDMITVSSQTMEFQRDVISPNTHRTSNNQYFYYDYDDIAEYIQEDGRDFSTELYMTYSNLGEYQTNRVMDYTNYASVEAYVKHAGFDSIRDWEKSEREKLVLKSELEAMHSELNDKAVMDAVSDNYGGK